MAQSARLKASRIWLKSTGPRTAAGKKISSQNACKNGATNAAIHAWLSAQSRYLKHVRLWMRMGESRIASKATFSAVLELRKYREKLGFLLGKQGRKLLVSGIEILRENNV